MFSLFLVRNLEANSISLLEGMVFVYMLGDLVEEIWTMVRILCICFNQNNYFMASNSSITAIQLIYVIYVLSLFHHELTDIEVESSHDSCNSRYC